MDMRDKKNFIESFNCAINGIIESIKKERHMKIHIFASIGVILLSIFLDIDKYELLILILTVVIVIAAELLNTGIEKAVDFVSYNDNPLARFAKDAAAGGVLIASIGALLVGYIIFFDKLLYIFVRGHNLIKNEIRISNIFVLVMSLIMVVVICIKAYTKKGTALEGGMPSGHAAISASLFVMCIYLTDDSRILLISFIFFLLVCQSRVKSKIHTFKEVLAGALVGGTITFIVFNLIYR